jgi:mannose-6-phosphate isomerase-like protein (cupin superfamily)
MTSATHTKGAIDEAGFRAALARDGFEPFERSLPPGPRSEEHTHPFDARLLILEGAFTVALGGKPVTFRPGDVCEVAAGAPHTEEPGPEGVRYIAGRRHKG